MNSNESCEGIIYVSVLVKFVTATFGTQLCFPCHPTRKPHFSAFPTPRAFHIPSFHPSGRSSRTCAVSNWFVVVHITRLQFTL